jgi:predicted RNase H-like nuclease (RuvC/YqgF family)
MTVLGKILVFLNLVFSLVVAGLIVFVYAARTNWATAYQEYQNRDRALTASLKAAQDQAETARADYDKKLQALEGQRTELVQQLQAKERDLQAANTQLKNAQTQSGGESASVKAAETALKKREEEVRTLEQALKDKDTQVAQIIKLNRDLRDEKVNAEIQVSLLTERMEQVNKQLEDATRQLVAMRRSGISIDPTAVAARENPPPASVEGIIKQTDTSGLMTITIGSDAGLQKGHTLDVYRYGPTPQYLGQIRLFDVRPNEAVARPVGRMKAPVQAGDRVGNLNSKG